MLHLYVDKGLTRPYNESLSADDAGWCNVDTSMGH